MYALPSVSFTLAPPTKEVDMVADTEVDMEADTAADMEVDTEVDMVE